MMRKNYFFIFNVLFTAPHALSMEYVPIDHSIAQACGNYLTGKGFSGVQFRASTAHARWDERTYACTNPRRVIFMSPKMLASINQGLISRKSVPIYDKYVLLHEMGHNDNDVSNLFLHATPKVKAAVCLAYVALSVALHAGLWYHSTCLSPDELLADETPKDLNWRLTLLDIGCIGLLFHIYLHDVPVYYKNPFVKCKNEEYAADLFAMGHLSAQELLELEPAIPIAMGPNWEEDGLHQNPKDKCAMVLAELARRRGHTI